MANEGESTTFSIRLPSSVLAEIDHVAVREVRSRSGAVLWLLRMALALDSRNAALVNSRKSRVG